MAVDADAPGGQLSDSSEVADGFTAAPGEADTETGGDAGDYDSEADHRADAVDAEPTGRSILAGRGAVIVGVVIVLALAGLVGWLGFRTYQSRQAYEQRQLFLQVGRQAAIDLTTVDFAEADTDIHRILDSATGTFYDDFSKRSQPFVDALKQAQSKSVGTVTEAGVESESGDQAQVLVAVSVKTTTAGAAEQQSRGWRMRISVQDVGAQAKVSNVVFVP